MFKKALLSGVIAIGMTNPSLAASAREMSPSELRKFAESGNTVSMRDTLHAVSQSLHAEVVEARAYEAGTSKSCRIYYRLVMKQTNGQLVSVLIDAITGEHVPSKSDVSREVSKVASVQTAQNSFDAPSKVQVYDH